MRGQVRRLIIFIALAVFLGSALGFADTQYSWGKKVFALYKKSDNQTDKENEINWYLSKSLKDMGFEIVFYDIDRGIPALSQLTDVRVVISWFRGNAMNNPIEYILFLSTMIDLGKKVIVLDNFGAYQDAKTGEYVNVNIVNIALSRLGLLYFGDWTQETDKLEVDSEDKGFHSFNGLSKDKMLKFYYRFQVSDRNLKVVLALKRTDRDYGASPVIVYNSSGGFALSTYIYHFEDGKTTLLLDLAKYVAAILFPQCEHESIVIMAEEGTPYTENILTYTREVLAETKLPVTVIRSSRFNQLVPSDLKQFSAVGLILSSDSGLTADFFAPYLDQGGGIVSLRGGSFKALAPLLGFSPVAMADVSQKGLVFDKGFILGNSLTINAEKTEWQPSPLAVDKSVKVYAKNKESGIPLLWSLRSGKIWVWNWNSFALGYYQGLIVESFLAVRPAGAAAVLGVGVLFLDDWPCPMYNVVKKPLTTTDTEFYTKVWWPEIKKLHADYHIPPNAFLIFNYNAVIKPPFTGGEFYVSPATRAIAREILANGWELQFHGYNHVSLTTKKTDINIHAWESVEDMKGSLQQAKTEWIRLFGEHTLPFAYVAPHNIISADGIRALKEVFPSIKVVSALRGGTGEETKTIFGPNPEIPDIFFMPRTSWGYENDQAKQLLILSSITGPGFFSHFIHADDIFDPVRSQGLSWPELLKGLCGMIDFVNTHYPWIRYLSMRDAYTAAVEFDNRKAEFSLKEDRMLIQSGVGLLLRLRFNGKQLKYLEGAQLEYLYKDAQAAIIRTTQFNTTVYLK